MAENRDPTIFNHVQFYESLTYEFNSVKNRVRNLIGDSNWGEDGRYKERILISALKKVVPEIYTIGTGFFVASEIGSEFKSVISSSQIDALIYDKRYPLQLPQLKLFIVPKIAFQGLSI